MRRASAPAPGHNRALRRKRRASDESDNKCRRMRFHHSTRRGRHSGRQQLAAAGGGGGRPLPNKLNYDRETNIHFHRRLPVNPPGEGSARAPAERNLEGSLLGLSLEGEPAAEAAQQQQQQQHQEEQLDMELARARLLAQVEKHPLWSSKAARRMQLTGSEPRRIYLYELVSFCERRELEWRYEPCRGPRAPAQLPVCALPAASPLRQQDASPPARPKSACAASHQQQRRPAAAAAAGAEQQHLLRRSISGGGQQRPEPGVGECGRALPTPEQVWAAEPPGGAGREPFVGYKTSAEVARSSFVKRCHGCQGRGRLKCPTCFGAGHEVCFSCTGRGTTRHASHLASGAANAQPAAAANRCRAADSPDQWRGAEGGAGGRRDEPGGIAACAGPGSGWPAADACGFCHGAGQKRCWYCAGRGHSPCPACAGACQLRCYLALNFTWLNHRDELVLNNADGLMARDRLRLAPGLCLLDQAAARLRPLSRPAAEGVAGAEDSQQVRAASRRLLDKHGQLEGGERLLRQRQRLHRLDCHVVHYEWRQRRGHFVLYDQQRKVYVAKYPFRSFCSIT